MESMKPWFDRSGMKAASIKLKPRNKKPKPTKARPRCCQRSVFEKRPGIKPKPIKRRAYLPRWREMIQPVMVVPIFAPRITPKDWRKVIRPAFTKPTVMTVVIDED